MNTHNRAFECPYCDHVDFPVRGLDRLRRRYWLCPACRGILYVPEPRKRKRLRQPQEAW